MVFRWVFHLCFLLDFQCGSSHLISFPPMNAALLRNILTVLSPSFLQCAVISDRLHSDWCGWLVWSLDAPPRPLALHHLQWPHNYCSPHSKPCSLSLRLRTHHTLRQCWGWHCPARIQGDGFSIACLFSPVANSEYWAVSRLCVQPSLMGRITLSITWENLTQTLWPQHFSEFLVTSLFLRPLRMPSQMDSIPALK